MPRIIVITGTDTGSGKTVLTSLLARHLQTGGSKPIALKPICSGGRDDAQVLRGACENALSLDETNPWHFRASLAPLLAARKESRNVALRDVVMHVRNIAHRFDPILVEGAGGLLSPLGDHFSTRELIMALGADVIIAARNQLGAINHIRLTLDALAPLTRARVRVVLMTPRREGIVSQSNPDLLAEFIAPDHVYTLPWLARPDAFTAILANRRIQTTLASLVHP